MSETFDEKYTSSATYFGSEPEPLLRAHVQRIDADRPVLDVGAGQGRHALFLARKGIEVHGVDNSLVAVEGLAAAAKEEDLPIEPRLADILDEEIKRGAYSAVLLFGLIQTMSRRDLAKLALKLREATAAGDFVFLTAFSNDDEGYEHWSKQGKPVGHLSFDIGGGELRTYLDSGEIPEIFTGFSLVHCFEGRGRPHRHGNGPIERHAVVEALLSRIPQRDEDTEDLNE